MAPAARAAAPGCTADKKHRLPALYWLLFAHRSGRPKRANFERRRAGAREEIRDEHQSERLRKAAAKYLDQIAREVG